MVLLFVLDDIPDNRYDWIRQSTFLNDRFVFILCRIDFTTFLLQKRTWKIFDKGVS